MDQESKALIALLIQTTARAARVMNTTGHSLIDETRQDQYRRDLIAISEVSINKALQECKALPAEDVAVPEGAWGKFGIKTSGVLDCYQLPMFAQALEGAYTHELKLSCGHRMLVRLVPNSTPLATVVCPTCNPGPLGHNIE